MKQLADVIFSPLLITFYFIFSPLPFELASTEHPEQCGVYLGQESSFMHMTPRQSRRAESGDEGR